MENRKKHYIYIDALRIISSIMVIITHVVMHNIYIYRVHSLSWIILTFTKILTQFAVPCFFMISGAMLFSDPHNISYIEFMKRRISKIFFPFLLWSFLYYVYFSFMLNYYEFNLIDYINRFLRQDISGHFWYMYALISLYMLVPFVKKYLVSADRIMIRNSILVLSFFGSVIPVIAEISEKLINTKLSLFTIGKIGVYLNYMIIGYYIHTKTDYNRREKKLCYVGGAVMVLWQFICTYYVSVDTINQTWIDITWLPVMIFSVSVFMGFKSWFENGQAGNSTYKKMFINSVTFLAPLSFTAYLTHMLWLRTFQYVYPNDLLRQFAEKSGKSQMITLAEGILAVFLSYLLAFICKKTGKLMVHK